MHNINQLFTLWAPGNQMKVIRLVKQIFLCSLSYFSVKSLLFCLMHKADSKFETGEWSARRKDRWDLCKVSIVPLGILLLVRPGSSFFSFLFTFHSYCCPTPSHSLPFSERLEACHPLGIPRPWHIKSLQG